MLLEYVAIAVQMYTCAGLQARLNTVFTGGLGLSQLCKLCKPEWSRRGLDDTLY